MTRGREPGWERFLDIAAQTRSFALRRDLDALVRMEFAVLMEVASLLPRHLFAGVEFPGNLRVIHGNPDPAIVARPYATDHLRSDSWAREPSDVDNLILYIPFDSGASWMAFSNIGLPAAERLSQLRGDYSALVTGETPFEKVEYTP